MDIKSIIAAASKKYFTEVAQPKSPNEQRFVDQHTIEFWPHPVAFDSQFDGTIQKDTSRDADYQPGEDEAVYDQAYNESVEVSHDRYVRSHGKKAKGAGSWIFTKNRSGDIDHNDSSSTYQHSGHASFADASKGAKSWAKTHGHRAIYVAEESNIIGFGHLQELSRATLKSYADKAYDKSSNKKYTKESIEESFTPGELKFKDGSKAVVKEADASILNKLYSSLDTVRQKDMKEHVGKSVKNYKAVLEFAIATKGK